MGCAFFPLPNRNDSRRHAIFGIGIGIEFAVQIGVILIPPKVDTDSDSDADAEIPSQGKMSPEQWSHVHTAGAVSATKGMVRRLHSDGSTHCIPMLNEGGGIPGRDAIKDT